jgi:MoaA/NifB/PqqE/SkfB family radical SAM enzyme
MLELTNLCNLRCVMCGIWSERPHVTVDLDAFQDLLEQRTVRNVPVLALTGGEPFMMGNFEEYYHRAAEASPHSHINISTNGWYSDRTLRFLERADRRRLSFTISYDGVRSHDAVRRVDGSGQRLLATATAIRRRFPDVRLSLKMTVTNDNHGEILDTARQCRDLDIPFRFKTLEKLRCHQSRSPSDIDGPEYDDAILRSITEQGHAVLGLGIETNAHYIRALIRKNTAGRAPCGCSPRTVFVGVDGNVFLCRRMEPIGNARRQPLDAIWRSSRKRERVAEMASCPGAPLGLGFVND